MQVDLGYPLIMGLAIVTGLAISRLTQRPLAISPWQKAGILCGAFCGAMFAAKLPFVVSDWNGMLSGAAWFQDGKTILCGLAGGYAGVEVAKWCGQVRVRTGDSFAVPVAASVAVGRLGCFHAQCCFGVPTDLPWGVVFPQIDAISRHPTQIYESIFHAFAALILLVLWRKQCFSGNLIKLYILTYAVYRLFSELLRPEARWWGGMTGYQWLSLLLIAIFTALWVRDARRGEAGTPSPQSVSFEFSPPSPTIRL